MIISDGEKDNVPEEKLKQLQAELSHANDERVEKQSIYEIATSSPADSIPQVIDNERLSGYQVKLADLRRNLAELRSIYTPDHPKVKQVGTPALLPYFPKSPLWMNIPEGARWRHRAYPK